MIKPTRYYSNKQEKAVAKAVGGKQTANSGATAFSKGDVQAGEFLIECKTSVTQKKAFSIKEEWLDKLREETFGMGKSAYALCFDFGPRDNLRYYVISEREFEEYKYLKESYDGKDS